ncbi:MAG: FkbM family methyltransferase [Gemmatimonas sp.]
MKGSMLVGHRLFRRGLRQGVAAAIEHRGALRGLKPLMIVDVGANVGQFALLCRSLYPQARIYAFEPLAQAADTFSRLFAGDDKVTLIRSAVGNRRGDVAIHLSRRLDSSSLLPISPTMTEAFPGTDEVGHAIVPIAPLPEMLSSKDIAEPALLKIDVQGAELEVLRGCGELLQRFSDICVELSFVELYTGQSLCHEVIAYLAQRGFAIASIYNLQYGRGHRLLQADFLFSRVAPSTS